MADCLQCQSPIKSGRVDRKFCSDTCKNVFHNAERLNENAETSKIVLTLKQNRRILKLVLGEKDEIHVAKEILSKRGYDFDYHTHRKVSGMGNTFVLCFNYGFRELEGDRLKLVKWRKK